MVIFDEFIGAELFVRFLVHYISIMKLGRIRRKLRIRKMVDLLRKPKKISINNTKSIETERYL